MDHILIKNVLDINGFKLLIKKFSEDYLKGYDDNIYIELKEVNFINPFGTMALVLLIRSLYNNYNIKSIVGLPLDSSVRSYLMNTGLIKELENIAQFERVPSQFLSKLFSYTSKNYNFLPLTHIKTERDISPINDKVFEWLKSSNFELVEIMDILVLISELCQNVIYHSKTSLPGLFFMQAYTRRNGEKYCCISIGDSGIGIKNHLMRNPMNQGKIISDIHAIKYVMDEGISGVGDEEEGRFRGNGFTNLNRISRKYGANIHIHSHSGICSYKYLGRAQKRSREDALIFPVTGTQVCLEITGRNKVIDKLYN